MKIRMVTSLAVAILATVMLSLAPAHAVFSIDAYVIGSGGEGMTGGTYSLNGTLGQAVVGIATGGAYTLKSGFWHGIHR